MMLNDVGEGDEAERESYNNKAEKLVTTQLSILTFYYNIQ